MAAAAFCEREGDGEATGLVAAKAVREWKEEERFGPLCDYWFVLKQATDANVIELVAMPQSATGLMFRAQFDADALVSAGFVGSVDFDSRLRMLRGALSGDVAITTTVTAHSSDAIDVNITVPVADYFSLHIKLTLGCEPLDETQVLKAQLSEAVAECHSLKLQLAAAKTELKVAVGDATKKQLAGARAKVEALRVELERSQTQLDKSAAMLDRAIDVGDKVKKQLADARAKLKDAIAVGDETKMQLVVARAKAEELAVALHRKDDQMAEYRARMSEMERKVRDLQRQLKPAPVSRFSGYGYSSSSGGIPDSMRYC